MRARPTAAAAVATATVAALFFLPHQAGAQPAAPDTTEFTVLAADAVAPAAARAAIEAAGGTVLSTNTEIGLYLVAAGTGFAGRADASPALVGAARQRPVGVVPDIGPRPDPFATEIEPAAPAPADRAAPAAGMDPLDPLAWGLRMVHADQARAVAAGSRSVLVGVLDSGIDASHPDLAGQVDLGLSRNFARDMPDIDGPCEVPSCLDPVGVDDDGHGTHVAGTIAAAANGLGVSGVAPGVRLVELKGGQDSGFLFLGPVVNALTYAADIGVDVVNMSFYVDPWLYNCWHNPADTAEQQAEQRTVIVAMDRALRYAHQHGVTLVGSLGNNHEDLGNPRTDTSSPDYPAGTAHSRPIDNNTCFDLPIEGPNVIGVSALGPSMTKADYSNYGTEQISVAAPGGWFRDGYGTPTYRTNGNLVLSTYPRAVLERAGAVDAAGNVTAPFIGSVLKDCTAAGVCGYYEYLQGTSMAAPHATGVAALIVSRYGEPDRWHDGLTMPPDLVERQLTRTASPHACPDPPLQSYVREGRSAEFDALCTGTTQFNGFYGSGIVDAYAAVSGAGLAD